MDVMITPILTSSLLASLGFRHGFSTRLGGVSAPPFDSLDFAVQRDPEGLRENQRRLAEAVGFDPAKLHQVTQVHGVDVATADGDPAHLLARKADALIAEPGSDFAVAVRVADCVPVLVVDPASGRVAAVHAGWRGVEAKILAAVIARMTAGGHDAGAYAAAIGPCIGACCFETGEDVATRIAASSSEDVVARRDRGAGKAHVDLRLAVRTQLRALGISDDRIDDVPSSDASGCTRCDASRFHSYRRDGDASGRLVGVVVAGRAP